MKGRDFPSRTRTSFSRLTWPWMAIKLLAIISIGAIFIASHMRETLKASAVWNSFQSSRECDWTVFISSTFDPRSNFHLSFFCISQYFFYQSYRNNKSSINNCQLFSEIKEKKKISQNRMIFLPITSQRGIDATWICATQVDYRCSVSFWRFRLQFRVH